MPEEPERRSPEKPNIFPTEVGLRPVERPLVKMVLLALSPFAPFARRLIERAASSRRKDGRVSAAGTYPSAGRPLKVLVLDDNVLVALDIADFVEAAGHEVSARCANGPEALRAIAARPPDFAVIDVNLGRGETCEEVAKRLVDLKVPFAFVTGYGQRHAAILRRFNHATTLQKPHFFDGLLKELRAAQEAHCRP